MEDACTLDLPQSMTNDLFPWHFALDRELRIVSAGKNLVAHLTHNPTGTHAKKMFKLIRPVDCAFNFDTFAALDGVSCLFMVDSKHLSETTCAVTVDTITMPGAVKDTSDTQSLTECPFSSSSSRTSSSMSSKRTSASFMKSNRLAVRADNIKLHGQLTYSQEHDVVIFFGTPALRSLEEMESQGIALAEMPLHSHGRELLYGSMFQSTSAKNSTAVDDKLAALDDQMLQVQVKKEQIDSLLHSILPPVSSLSSIPEARNK